MDRDKVEVQQLAKKERGQYPALRDRANLVNKGLLYGFRENFAFGIQRVLPSGPDGASNSQSRRAIWVI